MVARFRGGGWPGWPRSSSVHLPRPERSDAVGGSFHQISWLRRRIAGEAGGACQGRPQAAVRRRYQRQRLHRDLHSGDVGHARGAIGRASCRARVCTYVEISVVDVTLKKTTITNKTITNKNK